MLRAINLDRKFLFRTEEVNNVITNSTLSPEFTPALIAFEIFPEHSLLRCRIIA